MLKISVIIPHRNNADGLERALNSVREQSYQVSQTVLIDDSSDAVTRSAVRMIADTHRERGFETVLIWNQRRLGPGPSRNLGWNAADCDLIAFLDSDDEWHPNKIEVQTKLFEDRPLLSLACHQFSPGSWAIQQSAFSAGSVKNLKALDWLAKNWAPTSTVMLRTNTPFRFAEDRHYSEDYELWLNIALSGASTCYLQPTLARPDKPAYGHSGLSQDLLKMERGELKGIKFAMRQNDFGRAAIVAVQTWSIIKFLRRVLRVYIVRLPTQTIGRLLRLQA